MKPKIKQITIPNPCQQDWDEMKKLDGYNFCTACSKCVIDFTGYSNAEIIKTLSNAQGSVCGRLSLSQLNQLNYHLSVVPATNRNWMKYLGVLAIGASLIMHEAKADVAKAPIEFRDSTAEKPNEKHTKVKKIVGYVLNANNKPIAGIRLSILNTSIVMTTDEKGRYEFKIPDRFDYKNTLLKVESIQFSGSLSINYEKELQLPVKVVPQETFILGKIVAPVKGR
ncbi:carboxypeptidase-like regulatory domain-containing protein [Pedobacter rhizosphaerae]|uniref:CarboxypepD_reg-like domain-containing protein n=1 Tax=Pedobacter rhizosphaerae TaxID=390241 RepID=A0A1H9MWA7_9SPHI|nr:carboxypeptidase-like regulatory domain-containing protein [Pedobacter rhizosphaerae]SER27797.1 hypothetical protein SAMN04488023_106177 [Pedobacter rhizosphaerae]